MITPIVFFGSAEFSLPSLQSLIEDARFEVVGVVTRTPKPVGRKQLLTPTRVEDLARANNIPVVYSAKDSLKFNCTLAALVSYGEILSNEVLAKYSDGIYNVHPSLLPRWRGPSPMQAALLHGDEITGVSIMKLDSGMDTGPVCSQQEYECSERDTYATLHATLAKIGAVNLLACLLDVVAGKAEFIQQDDAVATYSKLVCKEDGRIQPNDNPVDVMRKLRAYSVWPGVYGIWPNDKRVKILEAHMENGDIVFDVVQPAGKKAMQYAEYLVGNSPLILNTVLDD